MPRNVFSYIATVIGLSVILAGQAQHVLFGEHKPDPLSVFFDCQGTPYPDFFIPDTSLVRYPSGLESWYASHPSAFSSLLAQYGLKPTGDFSQEVKSLNEAVFTSWATAIRKLAGDSLRPVFMVHGFRKPFKHSDETTNSTADFNAWTKTLRQHMTGILPVRVHWDGMYACCFSMSAKHNKPLFDVFQAARAQSVECGKGLARLLIHVGMSGMEMQTHSLGAMLAMGCLRELASLQSEGGNVQGLLVNLIAPAISPEDLNVLYASTTEKGRNGWRIHLITSKKDMVLRKKDVFIGVFGPGPHKHGDTSLGCDHRKCATRLSAELSLKYPDAPVMNRPVDDIGKCHHIYCYTRSALFAQAIR